MPYPLFDLSNPDVQFLQRSFECIGYENYCDSMRGYFQARPKIVILNKHCHSSNQYLNSLNSHANNQNHQGAFSNQLIQSSHAFGNANGQNLGDTIIKLKPQCYVLGPAEFQPVPLGLLELSKEAERKRAKRQEASTSKQKAKDSKKMKTKKRKRAIKQEEKVDKMEEQETNEDEGDGEEGTQEESRDLRVKQAGTKRRRKAKGKACQSKRKKAEKNSEVNYQSKTNSNTKEMPNEGETQPSSSINYSDQEEEEN